jgi:hypothetical protein
MGDTDEPNTIEEQPDIELAAHPLTSRQLPRFLILSQAFNKAQEDLKAGLCRNPVLPMEGGLVVVAGDQTALVGELLSPPTTILLTELAARFDRRIHRVIHDRPLHWRPELRSDTESIR